ncbi:MAG: DUF1624 domain-containing protein [Ignavibacteriales bacterium]|nr:DUF1624 domain-containing protein [Ignavibacteriales bacterium]
MASSRFHFVDILRGWAVFVMIETHVVNALLLPEIKNGTNFKILTFINGLVAPSFLFCAGFALAISLSRKWNQYVYLENPFWKYIQRLIFILIVGYSLHLPFFSFRKLLNLNDNNAWVSFFQVDILHTIAVTLIALTLLAAIFRKQNAFMIAAGLIGLFLIFSAPIIRSFDYSQSVVWLRPYFTPQYKSQFPIFPWSAFLIGGSLIGFIFIKAREHQNERKMFLLTAMFGIFSIVVSIVIEFLPFSLYAEHNFWKASPEFFFVRFGIVLLLLTGLWKYETRKGFSGKSFLSIFGQESLLVYVVHLLIVYGYTYPWSFIRYFGPTLNYLESIGLFIILTGVMFIVAYVWHGLKEWSPRSAKAVQYIWLTVIVIAFLLKPD